MRLEQSFQRALFLPSEKKDYFIRFTVEGLLRGDFASRTQGYSTAIQNGWMSPNDVRELENMNPIPIEEGGSTYMVNGNMLKLKDVGAYIKEKNNAD